MALFCCWARCPFAAASSVLALAPPICRPERWACGWRSRLFSQRLDVTDELGGKAEGRANAAQLDRVDRQSPHSSQSTSATHAKVTALTTAAGAARAEGPARSYVSAEVLTDMSRKFNQLTGYESIDHLKGRVVEADKQLQQCKQQLRAAKIEYEQQLAKQNQLHREVTALLQRKSSWVPADVARFTELYAAEHQTEQAVAEAKSRYTVLSDNAERWQLQLVDLIRERYQQEQLWSDKIRRASTWWTWGLMGLHFASFVLVYTLLEPRKRASLQAAIADMLQQHAGAVDAKIMSFAPAAVDADASEGERTDQQQCMLTKQQQQQQQKVIRHDALVTLQNFQQQIIEELQLMRQQMSASQQTEAAAAVGATSAASSVNRSWHVPGSRWAAQQWVNTVESIRSLRESSRHLLQQVSTRHRNQSVGQSQEIEAAVVAPAEDSGTAAPLKAAAEVDDTAGKADAQVAAAQQQAELQLDRATDSQRHNQLQQGTAEAGIVPAAQQQQTGSKQLLPTSPRSLTEQWRLGETVLELTRGQLATVTAAAGAVGASVAGLLILLLSSSRGAAGGAS